MYPDQTTDTDGWTVYDHDEGNARTFENRDRATEAVETVADLGGEPELIPPGETVADADTADTQAQTETDSETDPEPEPPDAEVVEVTDPDAEPEGFDPEQEAEQLPERSVADDPLTWMPGDFVDRIDGTPAINRKGYEVLSHFYDVDVDPTLQVAPEETDHTYCRVKCKATTAEGREVAAFGSAHVDRGDDAELLLEMASTRARKRALSIATGVGAVAVAELKNEVDHA